MADQRRRFELWRTKTTKNTSYLVDQVLARILPEFQARGFEWYPDFAGGSVSEIASQEIPSQRPYRRLDAEVTEAVSLLPVLFDLFDQGIPAAWLERDFGYVHKHVMLMGSWHIFSEQRRKRVETATDDK